MATIKTFRDLKVWAKAHRLVLEIYQLSRSFPSFEVYGLGSQMRRAVVSVASNIVEGFARRSVRDSMHFYNIAHGSLEEVKYQLLIAVDLQYSSQELYKKTFALAEEVSKLLRSWRDSQQRNSYST